MLLTIVVFVAILALLIFVHEFGHFITAKKSGMAVEEFGFGFPPRMFGIKKGGTIYSLNWIPLGGFVRIKGENGEARNEPDSFGYKPFRKKALVLCAGVLMNIILAFVLLSVGFMVGLPSVVEDTDWNKYRVEQPSVQVFEPVKDSPADRAGIKSGDTILEVDGLAISNITELQDYLKSHQQEPISFKYNSGGEILEKEISLGSLPGYGEEKVLGVQLIQVGYVKFGFFESIFRGAVATWNLLIAIVVAFYSLIKDLILGAGVSADLAGPVGVAALTGEMVGLGWRYVLRFTAVLSLNLAVINILPFPALDGGRLLGIIIEKIRRKPNNQKIENLIHGIGFMLLMLLIIIVTYRDLAHYSVGLLEKIKGIF